MAFVSVKLKYVWQKSKGSLLFFKRRVPDDIKPLLPAGSKYAGKIHYVVSLQTTDPRVASKLILALVRQTDEDWSQLRNPLGRGGFARPMSYCFLMASIRRTPRGHLKRWTTFTHS
jgi:hypothetical protein